MAVKVNWCSSNKSKIDLKGRKSKMSGPLKGIKVVELAGAGPGPFCSMLLADLGATVLRVEKPVVLGREVGVSAPLAYSPDLRNRCAITLDLKDSGSVDVLRELVDTSDVLIETFRPGVAERLGIGPDVCLQRNPRLVYGRMTGWGQTGPMAQRAGHDLNYIGLTGVLEAIGRNGHAPTPPLTLVGDYGGGALYLTVGILAGLLEAKTSGKGQVVDAAIVDGVVSLASTLDGFRQAGLWNLDRGSNLVDSGCPYYDVYETSDHRYMAFAPIEERFYSTAIDTLGLNAADVPDRNDPSNWVALREILRRSFLSQTRSFWTERFDGVDGCVTPVLNWDEARNDAHLRARNSFVNVGGVMAAAPAPRFSRTMPEVPQPGMVTEANSIESALKGWLPTDRIRAHILAGRFVLGEETQDTRAG